MAPFRSQGVRSTPHEPPPGPSRPGGRGMGAGRRGRAAARRLRPGQTDWRRCRTESSPPAAPGGRFRVSTGTRALPHQRATTCRLHAHPGVESGCERGAAGRVPTRPDSVSGRDVRLHSGNSAGARQGFVSRAMLGGIRGYQLVRSGRPSPCRFTPSCSVYGFEAIQRHGAVRGSWLTVRRLARCHPWGGFGFDPIPD